MDVLYALQPKYVRIYSRIRVQVLPSTIWSMVDVAQITVTEVGSNNKESEYSILQHQLEANQIFGTCNKNWRPICTYVLPLVACMQLNPYKKPSKYVCMVAHCRIM